MLPDPMWEGYCARFCFSGPFITHIVSHTVVLEGSKFRIFDEISIPFLLNYIVGNIELELSILTGNNGSSGIEAVDLQSYEFFETEIFE